MIRKFNPKTDFELLLTGELEAFTNSYPGVEIPINFVTERVRSIEKGRSSCTVLDEAGLMGYLISTQKVVGERVETYIESIYLSPEVRRKGNVSRLIQSVLVTSLENVVSLDVSVSNSSAVASYEEIGFDIERLRMTKKFPPKDD